jgi:periplasmic protein TonB
MNKRKTSGADLENKKFIFLELGMMIALGLVFLAFNWKTYDKTQGMIYDRIVVDVPEDLVPITEQKQPEPPKVQPPKIVTVINIVEDETTVDDNIMVNAEADQTTEVEEYIPPAPDQGEEESDDAGEIFTVVESMPCFPGGEANVYKYLADNVAYPYQAREAGISGKVWVAFVVEKDGSITDVKVLRGIGGGCDEEAVRVVEAMPRWTPGKQRGIPVRVHFVLSIKFTLG